MIVLDIEASGVDPYKSSMVSLGALDFEHPEKQFYGECRIWDGAHIEDEALGVCGFTRQEIVDPVKPREGELVKQFLDWALTFEDHTTAGQNPSFDRDYVRLACEREHIAWPLAHRTVDMHSVCYLHMIERGITPPVEHNRSALNSKAILNYVGIPEEPRPHNALMGAKVVAESLSRLFYNKKLLPEFQQFEIPWVK